MKNSLKPSNKIILQYLNGITDKNKAVNVLLAISQRLGFSPVKTIKSILKIGHRIKSFKQVDPEVLGDDPELAEELEVYEAELLALIAAANSGSIEQDEFEAEWIDLTIAILSVMALKGSGSDELSQDANDLITAAIVASTDAISALADSVYAGNFEEQDGEPPRQNPENRVDTWGNVAVGIFFAAMLFAKGNPWLEWVVGPTEHCSTCRSLDGKIMRKLEWLKTPFRPRTVNGALECGGYKCKCRLRRVSSSEGSKPGALPQPAAEGA